MITLHNGILTLRLDDQGQLIHLESHTENTGNLIHTPAPLMRTVLHTGDNWEDVAFLSEAEKTFAQDETSAVITISALNTRMGRHDVRMTLSIRLDGEKVLFDASVDNQSESTLVDFVYPCVGGVYKLGGEKPGLLLPLYYGAYHTDIIGELRADRIRDGRYQLSENYPGYMSMQWMTLMGGGMSLYLTSRDAELYTTAFRAESRADDDVVLEIDKMAFTEPGKQWKCPSAMLWLYRGSWQPGAEEYRDWSNAAWRKQVKPKQWVNDMTGYFLVIEKQQYGDVLWPYKDIPALYDLAQEYGFNTLGLFGWYKSGHDTQYPDLEVSDEMGGEAMLKEKLREVQAKGGHVTLYHQGHLIDVNSPFYQQHGDEVEAKTRWNNPYYEQYNKFTYSDFLRNFTRKTFSLACPHSKLWQDVMATKADWIHGLGANGVLYDQIGGRPSIPCFAKNHGHDNPSTAYSQGRVQLLSRIRKQVDKQTDYAFFSENMTDVYAQFLDCVHGTGNIPSAHGSRAGLQQNKTPRIIHTPGVFRHTFPDAVSTVRNFRPYIDPITTNYCLCYGLRMEMELRTFKDMQYVANDPHPEWRAYAKAASELLQRYPDLLLRGDYHCDAELSAANPELHHGRFTCENGECIVLWNDTDKELPVNLAGHSATRWESPEASGDGVPATIAPSSLIVLF